MFRFMTKKKTIKIQLISINEKESEENERKNYWLVRRERVNEVREKINNQRKEELKERIRVKKGRRKKDILSEMKKERKKREKKEDEWERHN